MQAPGSVTRAITDSARLISPLARMVADYARPTDGEALICILTIGPIQESGISAELDNEATGVIFTIPSGAWRQMSADEFAEWATGARRFGPRAPWRPAADAIREWHAMYR